MGCSAITYWANEKWGDESWYFLGFDIQVIQITWGSVLMPILLWWVWGRTPDSVFLTSSQWLFQKAHFEEPSLRVSPWVCLLWSQVLDSLVASRQHPVHPITSVIILFEIFLARNNSSFPEPALLGEERCLNSFQRLQKNKKKLTKEAIAFKGATFCWEQLSESQLPIFQDW